MNSALKFFETNNITETNNLIVASSVWVSRKLGLRKPTRNNRKANELWWKRRIKDSIEDLNRCINLLTRHLKGELKSNKKINDLYKRFGVPQKGIGKVIEELKERVLAKVAKLERYTERVKQFRQNHLFLSDQNKLFLELDSQGYGANEIPDAEESQRFWSETWGEKKEHRRDAEWVKHLKKRE